MVRVDLHHAAIASLTHEEWFRTAVERTGHAVADLTRATAPRTTIHHPPPPGHGADSIHPEVEDSLGGWHARVSWDQEHWYLVTTHSHALQAAAYAVVGR